MTGSTYAPPPHRFEAGTPPIAQAVGLAAAAQYLSAHRHGDGRRPRAGDHRVRARRVWPPFPGLRILGPTEPVDRGGAVSFTLPDIHPHDVSQLLDSRGIAVRGGHHCARPLHERFGVQSSTRASFYLYTTTAEIDALVDGLRLRPAVLRRSAGEGRGALPGDHPGPLPGQAPQRSAGAVRGRGASRQPELRGRGDAAGAPRPRDEVADVSYEGVGCSISQASTSVMTDLVIGHAVEHGLELYDEFLTMMQGQGQRRAGRGPAGGRHRLRRRGQVPGPGEVCAARLVGVQGRRAGRAGQQTSRRPEKEDHRPRPSDHDRYPPIRPGAGRPARGRPRRADGRADRGRSLRGAQGRRRPRARHQRRRPRPDLRPARSKTTARSPST